MSILQEILNDKFYKNYCKKLCKRADIHNDLYQEFCIIMFEKESELININEKYNIKCYCISIIYRLNYHRVVPTKKINPCKNPLFELSKFTNEFQELQHVETTYSDTFDNVLTYLEKDKTIKLEDICLLFESTQRKVIDIHRVTKVPYITLKTKLKNIKTKIKQNVVIDN